MGGASKTGVGGCGNGGQKPHPRDKPGSPPTGQAHRPHSCTDFSWGMGRQWRVPQLRVTVALSHPKRGSVVQNWAILGTWEQVKPTKAWNSPVRAPRWESALGGSWGELESGQANSAGIRKLLQALKCVSNGRAALTAWQEVSSPKNNSGTCGLTYLWWQLWEACGRPTPTTSSLLWGH